LIKKTPSSKAEIKASQKHKPQYICTDRKAE
jgi:hypothetical protein